MADFLLAILMLLLFIAAAITVFLALAVSVETLVWAGHKITGQSYRWGDISSNCPPNCPIKSGGGSGN